MDFLIGGTAATCAGVFSNPFDVIKTRQQLQGELQKHVKNSKQLYGNQWQAIKNIVRAEGIAGLQKGITFLFSLPVLIFILKFYNFSLRFSTEIRFSSCSFVPVRSEQYTLRSI